jgi:hypothetical protein
MQAWPPKHKLVKLAKACSPRREPNSRSGAVTTLTLAIQVAAQIGRILHSVAQGFPYGLRQTVHQRGRTVPVMSVGAALARRPIGPPCPHR